MLWQVSNISETHFRHWTSNIGYLGEVAGPDPVLLKVRRKSNLSNDKLDTRADSAAENIWTVNSGFHKSIPDSDG